MSDVSEKIKLAKLKLRQSIERKIFEFNDRKVKEQVIDFTVLYLRRNNIPHDSEQLAKILDVFRLAMDDSYFKNIDILMGQIDADVDVLVEAVDPLDSTSTTSSKKVLVETVRETSKTPTAKKEAGSKASKASKSR